MQSAYNHSLVLFYSAKSVSDHFMISEFFKFFFQKIIFFHCFEPYIAKVRNMRSEKNHFSCSLIVQNPIQTILRFQIFQVFFSKINFFTVSIPYTAQVRKVQSAYNQSLVLFYSAKSVSDHFMISEFFKFFFSKNHFFFTVSNPILQRWETWGQKKIIFRALW